MKTTVFGFGITSSLLLSFAINSEAKAASFTELPPVPPELAEQIEMAEAGTLPDPLVDPSVITLWSPAGRVSFINTADQNGGNFSLFDTFVPPNNGVPLHFHTRENEWFYVASGNINFQIDNNLVQGEPGTLLFSPVLQRHAVRNTTSEPARILLFYEPVPEGDPIAIGNIERLFKDPRAGDAVNLNDPTMRPAPVDPAGLLEAAPEYGLSLPSTFALTRRQYTGDEVTILRTGVSDEAANVTLGLSNGLDIPVNFGVGEFLQTVTLPSEVSNQRLDLILQDPSPNSFIASIEARAVITPVPEPSFSLGLLAFGGLAASLRFKRKQNSVSQVRQSIDQSTPDSSEIPGGKFNTMP